MVSQLPGIADKLPLFGVLSESRNANLMGHAVTLVPCGHTFDRDMVERLALPRICPLDHKPIVKTITCTAITSLITAARNDRDAYLDLLINLLQHPSVLQDSFLIKTFWIMVDGLKTQHSTTLDPEQDKFYTWIQKLLVDDKVSEVVRDTLFALWYPNTLASQEALDSAMDHLFGRNGKKQDLDRAAKQIRTSAELGHPKAQYYMGWLCDEKRRKDLDLEEILRFDATQDETQVAKPEDRISTIRLLFLNHSHSQSQSFLMRQSDSARSWYGKACGDKITSGVQDLLFWHMDHRLYPNAIVQKCRESAESSNKTALYIMGLRYSNGIEVENNSVEALNSYHKAADQEYAPAQFQIGWDCAKGGAVRAPYYQGRRVVDGHTYTDLAEAITWYRRASDQEYPRAQYNLAWCYMTGQGLERDAAKAAELFEKAAKQEFAPAQYCLAWCYGCGKGVAEDKAKALEWYHKAADNGDGAALHHLASYYRKGQETPLHHYKALELYHKAANKGYLPAQYSLALWYANGGEGIPKVTGLAEKWFLKANRQPCKHRELHYNH